MRAGAPGVHHALGDALVVEVRDLLAQVVVLQQRRAALPAFSEWSVSGRRRPCAVVRYAPAWARESSGAPVGLPVGDTASGGRWSALVGAGSRGAVGSSKDGGSDAGAPGTTAEGAFSSASGEGAVAVRVCSGHDTPLIERASE